MPTNIPNPLRALAEAVPALLNQFRAGVTINQKAIEIVIVSHVLEGNTLEARRWGMALAIQRDGQLSDAEFTFITGSPARP